MHDQELFTARLAHSGTRASLLSIPLLLLTLLAFPIPSSAAAVTLRFGVIDGSGAAPEGHVLYTGESATSPDRIDELGFVPRDAAGARWVEIEADETLDCYVSVAAYVTEGGERLYSEPSETVQVHAAVAVPEPPPEPPTEPEPPVEPPTEPDPPVEPPTEPEPPVEPPTEPAGDFYISDFEEYADGDEPAGWVDTSDGFSLSQDPELFLAMEMRDRNIVFGTEEGDRDIHSHLVRRGSIFWQDYELSGRMTASSSVSGVGVTLYSGFPDSVAYYALKGHSRKNFALESVGGGTCAGSTDTGVRMDDDIWWEFRVQAFAEDGGTRLRAKVWEEGDAEPQDWQADCIDESGSRSAGRVGLWARSWGDKFWDDLRVSPLD